MMKRILSLLLTMALLPCGLYARAESGSSEYDVLLRAVESIRKKTDFVPEVALVLGTGLGGLTDACDIAAEINYSDIEGFPVPTNSAHAGKMIFGWISGVPVVMMQGRVHYYEGWSSVEVVRPVRVLGMLGAKIVVLTNSSGAVSADLGAGDMMMITDHIMVNIPSPLIGPEIPELGTRFPDMAQVYDPELQEMIRRAADACGVPLREGVYLQTSGPNYETKAEVRMFRAWGADAVGMSTACEAVAAHHMGTRVCGISCVTCSPTDLATGWLTDEEVQQVAEEQTGKLILLIREMIKNMHEASVNP